MKHGSNGSNPATAARIRTGMSKASPIAQMIRTWGLSRRRETETPATRARTVAGIKTPTLETLAALREGLFRAVERKTFKVMVTDKRPCERGPGGDATKKRKLSYEATRDGSTTDRLGTAKLVAPHRWRFGWPGSAVTELNAGSSDARSASVG